MGKLNLGTALEDWSEDRTSGDRGDVVGELLEDEELEEGKAILNSPDSRVPAEAISRVAPGCSS